MIRGLKWREDTEDRISLYADDILLYLASPDWSIPALLNICEIFGSVSGYAINWDKSVLFILYGPTLRLPTGYNIPTATVSFKYLGIHISRTEFAASFIEIPAGHQTLEIAAPVLAG